MVLTYDAYNETLEEQKQQQLEQQNEVKKLKEEMKEMMETFREQTRQEFHKSYLRAKEEFLEGEKMFKELAMKKERERERR
jgi:hypothetical protein